MSREWKPGDVAALGDGHRALVVEGGRMLYGTGLLDYATPDSFHAKNARPLVVIDPEDREQVEQLRRKCDERWSGGPDDRTSAVQVALRSLIGTEKPDEPQGLGAVVKDADGELWVRGPAYNTYRWIRTDMPGSEVWRDLDVAEVLSEGWSA